MVLESGEEGAKTGLVQGDFAQGELDQVKLAQGELAQGKLAQEELPQVSQPLKATEVVQKGEKKEAMGEQAAEGASGFVDKKIHKEEVSGNSDQEQPKQEAAMPEGSGNPSRAVARVPPRRRHRFTLSQLQDLERLFHETRYPSLQAR